jgi:hypothetical protein
MLKLLDVSELSQTALARIRQDVLAEHEIEGAWIGMINAMPDQLGHYFSHVFTTNFMPI